MPTHSQPVNDARGNLQRRFTTDLTKLPTLPPIGQPPNPVVEPVEMSSTVSGFFVPMMISRFTLGGFGAPRSAEDVNFLAGLD